MQNWTISTIHLPLRFTWKISRNSSSFKENLIIKVSEGEFEGIGEVAFNIRYQECKEKILEEFGFFKNHLKSRDNNKDCFVEEDLEWLLNENQISRSLKMGINQAYLSLCCLREDQPLYKIMKVKSPGEIASSFSIPIINANDVKSFLIDQDLLNYKSLKLKINGLESITLVNQLIAEYKGQIRIDANEGFKDVEEVIQFIKSLDDQSRIEFIEQPLPAEQDKEMKELKGKFKIPFIADESITCDEDISQLADYFDGVNIKLMKSGTIENAKRQLEQAQNHNLKIMLGCMIETSLSISFAYYLSDKVDFIDLDGFLLIEEDPFHLLNEKDGIIRIKK